MTTKPADTRRQRSRRSTHQARQAQRPAPIRKARLDDACAIHRIVNYHADRGMMLPRSLGYIYENVRDFLIAEADRETVGCCALHLCWGELAEIKSLAVLESHRGKRIGASLVVACEREALDLGVRRLFALSRIPASFVSLGFATVDRAELPHKIWSECVNCPQFPDCDEVAVVKQLAGRGGS